MATLETLKFEDFPHQAVETIRYSDNNMSGHVSHLSFIEYIETGRMGFVYSDAIRALVPNTEFILAKMDTVFRKEMKWPGEVQIGSAVTRIGRISVGVLHALFKDGKAPAPVIRCWC